MKGYKSMKTIYDENETMQLLGRQKICGYICKDGIASTDFANVLNAERKHSSDFISVAADFFSLGLIYGKRAERAKRKNRK